MLSLENTIVLHTCNLNGKDTACLIFFIYKKSHFHKTGRIIWWNYLTKGKCDSLEVADVREPEAEQEKPPNENDPESNE